VLAAKAQGILKSDAYWPQGLKWAIRTSHMQLGKLPFYR
jgi:hypothetical protein